jgi:hypothetical protein
VSRREETLPDGRKIVDLVMPMEGSSRAPVTASITRTVLSNGTVLESNDTPPEGPIRKPADHAHIV